MRASLEREQDLVEKLKREMQMASMESNQLVRGRQTETRTEATGEGETDRNKDGGNCLVVRVCRSVHVEHLWFQQRSKAPPSDGR